MEILTFTPGSAIFVILIAAFMWGSWFQCMKHLDGYPLDGYLLHAFFFSVLLVFAVMFLMISDKFLSEIAEKTANKPIVVLGTLFGGAMYAIGMRINLNVMDHLGLVLGTAISSTCSVLIGTFLSVLTKAIDPDVNLFLLAAGALTLVAASIACVYSTILKNQERNSNNATDVPPKTIPLKRAIVSLLIAGIFFAPNYPLAMSIGLKSTQNPDGLQPIVFMFLLSLGAFIGIGIVSSTILIRRKRWVECVFKAPRKVRIMGLTSALAHYGGNIIHSFATPLVSVSIAWPLGQTYNMWSYFWGLAYGEYKGVSRKVIIMLVFGIALFVLGIALLGSAMYWNK